MGSGCGCTGCGCGLVSLLALAAAAFVGYQVFLAAPGTSPAVVSAPAATSVPAPTAAAQFDAKVATAAAQAKTAGSKKTVRLVLTEAELSAKATQAASSVPGAGAVQGVAVKIRDDSMVLTGRTVLAGMEVPLEAEVKLGAVDGKLAVDVTSIKAGNLPIPVSGPLRDTLVEQVRRAIGGDDLQGIDLGIDVKSVHLADGHLEIEGETR